MTVHHTQFSDLLQTYLNENPETGYLTFEVYQESPIQGRLPIPNAKITISKYLGDGFYYSQIITTNQDGETDPIPLPTVSRELSLIPGNARVYATYNASVEAPGFFRNDIYDIQIFDGITAIQRVNLQPITPDRMAQTNLRNYLGKRW